MNRNFRAAAAAALSLTMMTAQIARADGSEVDAATTEKATAAMTALGYDVRKVESEDGMIEVYAVKDGKTVTLKLDDALNITATE
jgi:Peptidase propeptide and YPEB domain